MKPLAASLRLLLAIAAGVAACRAQAATTIYVPGWLRCHMPGSGASTTIGSRARAAGETYEYFDWDGNLSWRKSLAASETAARRLAERLDSLPDSTLAGLTLAGHSLGGRIAVRTLAELARRNRKIKKAVILGAAMSASDPEIALACRAADEVVFVCNPRDVTLGTFYGNLGGEKPPALGLSGPDTLPPNATIMLVTQEDVAAAQIDGLWGSSPLCRSIAAHHAAFYLHRYYK